VYWIDDAFTNSALGSPLGYFSLIPDLVAGGLIPIRQDLPARWEETRRNNEDNDTGKLFFFLVEKCLSFGLSLCCASFEYLASHWQEVNRSEHLVLIDIGYNRKGASHDSRHPDNTYGIDLFLSLQENVPARARTIFFTVQPSSVQTWIAERQRWISHFPFALSKTSPQGGLAKIEIEALLKDYSSLSQPADLRASDWSSLRKALFDKLKLSAHHLPYGGQHNPTHAEVDLNAELSSFSLQLHETYRWEAVADAWKWPPARALGQFDADGRDLSKLFEACAIDTYRAMGTAASLFYTFPKAVGFEHDYLWFNGCVIAAGLHQLGRCFAHEVDKRRNTDPAVLGRLTWQFNEFHGNECGVRIRVSQALTLNSGNESERWEDLPFPIRGQGEVETSYHRFEFAGASISIDNGELQIRIMAKPEMYNNKTYWSLLETQGGTSQT